MDDAAVARMVLGAQLGEQTALFQSLMLFGGLLLALMLAAVFLLYVRGRLRRNRPEDVAVLSLDELRRLRDTTARSRLPSTSGCERRRSTRWGPA